jgi:hypothetical protein
MKIIEVDPFGDTFQALFHRGHDIGARSAFKTPRLIHGQAKLGCQDDILAAVTQRLAEQALGTAAVAVGVAVSMKVIPAAIAASTTSLVLSESSLPPKLLQPSPRAET